MVAVKPMIEVPANIIGMRYDEAADKLNNLGFTVELKETASSQEATKVISVRYAGNDVAGKKVEKGATLVVTYSKGLNAGSGATSSSNNPTQ